MKPAGLLCLLSIILVTQSAARADLLEFINGDRLHGRVLSMEDGNLKFISAVLGEVKVPVEKLVGINITEEANIHLHDGTVINQKLVMDDQGKVIIFSGAALTTVALSQINRINPELPAAVRWSGKLSSGLSIEQGNTESQDTYLDLNLSRETDRDRMTGNLEYQEKREEDPDTGAQSTSKRRYQIGAHYDYFLAESIYLYSDLAMKKEATANLDLRWIASGGVGYRWFDTARSRLELEAGLGWVDEKFSDLTPDNEYISLRTAWRYHFDINEQVRFYHSGSWFPSLEDAEDQLLKTETGVRSKINSHLFLEAKLLYDWDQTPAGGKAKEDTAYILGLGWEF